MKHETEILLADAISDWGSYAKIELGHSPTSVRQRLIRLRNFDAYIREKYALESPFASEVGVTHIRTFLHHLAEEKGVCSQTLRGNLECIRALFTYLVEYGYVKDSPAHRIPLPKKNPPKRELVSDEEVIAMFSACQLLRPELRAKMGRAVLSLYCYAGLRTNELLSLKLDDISFEGQDCFVQVACGKGGKRRVVPLHREGIGFVKDYIGIRPPVAYEILWYQDKRRPLQERGLHKLFSEIKWLARIDREGVKPHCLRHQYATRKLRDGVNLYHISQLLGHADIQTTITYLHSDLQQLTEAAQRGGLRERSAG